MKITGWQRLWVVCSVAWIVGVAVMYGLSRDSQDKLYNDWANELLAYLVEQSAELRGHTVVSVRSTYSDISDRQLVTALHEKYLPKHPAYTYGFAQIDAKYKSNEKPETETLSWGTARWLAIALGIPLIIYMTGVAVAWVRRGFRHA